MLLRKVVPISGLLLLMFWTFSCGESSPQSSASPLEEQPDLAEDVSPDASPDAEDLSDPQEPPDSGDLDGGSEDEDSGDMEDLEDAEDLSDMPDMEDLPDVTDDPSPRGSVVGTSAGGGQRALGAYRLSLSAGGPVAGPVRSSTNYTLSLGIGAARAAQNLSKEDP